MTAITRNLTVVGAFILTLSAMTPGKKIKVWMIGDSTMCLYDSTHSPLTGWGMPFANFFDSTVEVINKARGGRSTRTFIREHRWQEVVAQLEEGDYVFMQFGHNDEAKEPIYRDRYTPVPDYIANLTMFIKETRSKNANPILVTPVTRMVFDHSGNIEETHKEYTAAVWETGKKYGVPVIDLDSMSRQLLQKLGPDNAKLLFMQLDSMENPHYPDGQKDNTHFNEYGARRMAELVLADLKRQHIPIAERIFRPKTAVPSMAGVTGKPDTSFNINSAWISTKKSNPETQMVPEMKFASVRETHDITYCSIEDRKLALDVFYPAAKSSKARTAIIIIFGGGWRSGNRTMHYPLAEKLASLGYVCFTPEYRLSTEALYPAAIYDIKAAIRWVRRNAATYNVDTSHITSLGFSAGGEIAAFIGTTGGMPSFEGSQCPSKESSSVNAVIDIDGTLSFVSPEGREGNDSIRTSAGTYWFGFPKKNNERLWEIASPITYADEHTPPTLFINSALSWMHAGRTDYIKTLDKYNIYSEVHSFENAPHCFCLFAPWFAPTVAYIDGFLKKAFTAQPVYKTVFTVAHDGSGDYTSIQDAIDAMRVFSLKPITLYIKNGVYNEKIELPSTKTDVTFIGESADSTIIVFNDYSGKGLLRTFNSYTAKISGNRFTAKNITFSNTAGRVGQAVALFVDADQAVFYNCRFLGNQDTIYAGGESSQQLFEDCYIEGTVDFIFGPATALFRHCTIHCKDNAFITAANTPREKPFGFVLMDCTITADPSVDHLFLGRPWRPYAKTVFIRCKLPACIIPEGWNNWENPANEQTAFYAEYKNTGPGARTESRAAWSKQLTKQDAARYTVENILTPSFRLSYPPLSIRLSMHAEN